MFSLAMAALRLAMAPEKQTTSEHWFDLVGRRGIGRNELLGAVGARTDAERRRGSARAADSRHRPDKHQRTGRGDEPARHPAHNAHPNHYFRRRNVGQGHVSRLRSS